MKPPNSKQANIPSIAPLQECGFGREEQGEGRQDNPWRAVVRLLLLNDAATVANRPGEREMGLSVAGVKSTC